ncbi:MAG: peptidase [SAR86 cluster bacterium]|uniref:Peptidase n=1 Tax=SAR86 cluster bacterium TaxID=2030880 RepID=A0A2A5CE34_9GAMM|nr:peptidase [Gammaproteobacteria bacterium AH-315-E17]PCJ41765.1 MAG: peptidase [SAR86 cluster bacterium]
MFKKICALACMIGLVGCSSSRQSNEAISHDAIVETYIAIAQASYEDSLISTRVLEDAVNALLAEPNQTTLTYAKNAWLAARVPYQQTEAFRFGNAVVDEWEARVNSWPLDEGLIDYTAAFYGDESDNNYFYTANIIANELIDIGGISVDAAQITPQLLAETLHEIDGVESNVATGYHAIEFLLWGQDLNGTNPGAGNRPATDYSLGECTNRNCDRRRDYVSAVTSLLVSDLEEMVYNWQVGGAAYDDLMRKGPAGGLATILTGMGSLAYGELAGERIRLGLLLNDPEEEHDCFSDNTHNSHYYDALGIKNVYLGSYERINGDVISGASLAGLMNQEAPALAAEMLARLESTELAMDVLISEAARGNTFDVLIASNNMEGEEIISTVVDSLMEETRTIENIIRELNLQNVSLTGSDSLGRL